MLSNYDLFVFFGYLPKFSDGGIEWLHFDPDHNPGSDIDNEEWWLNEGIRTFKKTIADQVAETPENALHILPLSGGLDSRAILGGLLENLPANRIITTTYGIPGAWDYEIGQMIAKKCGLRHEAVNLLDEKWDLDDLVAAGGRLVNPVNVFEAYVRQKINNHFGKSCVYWGGFLGDSLSGMDMPPVPVTDKKQAIDEYLYFNRIPTYKGQFFETEVINKICAEYPWQDYKKVKVFFDEQLDLGLRQKFYIGPLTLVNGFIFKAPFISKAWVDYSLNVPYHLMVDQYLYKKMLFKAYPFLFKLPVKSKAGQPMYAPNYRVLLGRVVAKVKPVIIQKDPYRSHPRTNYINFTEALRHKSRLQDVVRGTLHDLIKRSIFAEADINKWWNEHLSRKFDHTRLLLNLSSLEILMKSGSI